MRRREFIGLVGGAAAWPFAAAAQGADRIVTIGYLGITNARPWTKTAVSPAFQEGLRDLGYIEGRNLRFEVRSAEGDDSRLPALADELAALNVDVIVTYAGGVYAARQATSTIPIVMASAGDVVASGLVLSLAHPGGNITGSVFFAPELLAKRLQLLKDIVPPLARAGLLLATSQLPGDQIQARRAIEVVRAAADALKVELFPIEVGAPEEFESAFATCDEKRVGGLVSADSAQFNTDSAAGAIAALAAARRLPAVGDPELAKNGGLLSYGVDWAPMFRRAAYFVDRILKGANPGDLPIEQATKFRTIVNLKTAKALDLDIPPTLLAEADEVIE